jgi:hypothetical protein
MAYAVSRTFGRTVSADTEMIEDVCDNQRDAIHAVGR